MDFNQTIKAVSDYILKDNELIREIRGNETSIVFMATFGMLGLIFGMIILTKIFKFIPLIHRFLGAILMILTMQLIMGFPLTMIMHAVKVPVLKIYYCWLTLLAGNSIFILFSAGRIKELGVNLEKRKLFNKKKEDL